jgi:HK97 family phage major capsid protein/ATP-dependent Clp endopeptidase proteolytic subunit ClpP
MKQVQGTIPNPNPLQAQNKGGRNDLKLFIYGEIDNTEKKGYTGEMDVKNVLDTLQPLEPLDIHINSIGGSVAVGIGIYNMLKAWKGKKTVFIDGWACSIASVIAMSGDEIVIADNGLMMIHKPLMALQGNASEMRKTANTLDTVETTLLNAYHQRTKQPLEKLSVWLDTETWFSAEDCIKYGFADRIGSAIDSRMVAKLDPATIEKMNVPKAVLEKINAKEQPMNKRDLQQAIADVRSQHEGLNDNEIMQKHVGFDLLLNKLHEQEQQEQQTKISAKAQTKEVKNFMTQAKQNDKIKILAKSDKFEPINKVENEPALSLGKIVKGAILGDWSGAESERTIYNANTTSAGILVPESLSATVIEAVRAESALNRAGALTVPMATSTVVIGKEVEVPTAHFKNAYDPITASNINFEGIELKAKTITAMVNLDQETLTDAQNIESLIASSLAKSLALAIDKAGIAGDGILPNPLGIENVVGLATTTLTAPITNTVAVSKAVQAIKEKNFNPTTAIYSATTEGIVDRLTNAVTGEPIKHFESYNALNKIVSNQLSDEVLVGDFKHLLMGIYKNITLDFSTTDADSWNNYGASFRVVARVDFAVTNKDAFVMIDGVTEAPVV